MEPLNVLHSSSNNNDDDDDDDVRVSSLPFSSVLAPFILPNSSKLSLNPIIDSYLANPYLYIYIYIYIHIYIHIYTHTHRKNQLNQ